MVSKGCRSRRCLRSKSPWLCLCQRCRGSKKYDEAAKWFRKAAEQGHAEAQDSLGVLYGNGWGVAEDDIEALAWFNLSAASGNRTLAAHRDKSERRVGRQATLIAQQRTKEILKEIEARERPQATAAISPPSPTPPSNRGVTKSNGSGAIVSVSGYVLTAAHVVPMHIIIADRIEADRFSEPCFGLWSPMRGQLVLFLFGYHVLRYRELS